MLVCVLCSMVSLLFRFVVLGNTVPISFHTFLSCSVAVRIFFMRIDFLCLYHYHDGVFFSSSFDNFVGLDVLIVAIKYFYIPHQYNDVFGIVGLLQHVFLHILPFLLVFCLSLFGSGT